jgi:hypothetical protein
MGSSLIEVWLMFEEEALSVVLMTGASLSTSTVPPDTGPIDSGTSSEVTRPTSTTTPSWLKGLKPALLIVTRYSPG